MTITVPHIDPYLFDLQYSAFKIFVERHSGEHFTSFSSNSYTFENEGYKYEVFREAREKLNFSGWEESTVGTGEILDAAIAAIELRRNNLVRWQARKGPRSRAHQPLYDAHGVADRLRVIEGALFRLYKRSPPATAFEDLVQALGRRYPLIAYLFFLKDRSRYLPIAPENFDRAFHLLGAALETSHQCSWTNYSQFVALIAELRDLLAGAMRAEVSLLDAHSFAWILASQMQDETADIQPYLLMPQTERDALQKARIGQGRFRDALVDYWSRCAVTGLGELGLLRASHIKPWADSTAEERLGLYNGLLLAPHVDAAFDQGYVTFADDGTIQISPQLKEKDLEALGLSPEMRLRKVEASHLPFLAYHRARIFKGPS